MVDDWREKWNKASNYTNSLFPFGFVQVCVCECVCECVCVLLIPLKTGLGRTLSLFSSELSSTALSSWVITFGLGMKTLPLMSIRVHFAGKKSFVKCTIPQPIF